MSVTTSIGSVIGVLVMGLALVFYLVFYTDSNYFPINFARQMIYKCDPSTVAKDEEGKVLDNPIRNGNFDYKGDGPFVPGERDVRGVSSGSGKKNACRRPVSLSLSHAPPFFAHRTHSAFPLSRFPPPQITRTSSPNFTTLTQL